MSLWPRRAQKLKAPPAPADPYALPMNTDAENQINTLRAELLTARAETQRLLNATVDFAAAARRAVAAADATQAAALAHTEAAALARVAAARDAVAAAEAALARTHAEATPTHQRRCGLCRGVGHYKPRCIYRA